MNDKNDSTIQNDITDKEKVTNLLESLPLYSTVEIINPFSGYSQKVLALPSTGRKQIEFPEFINTYCHSEQCKRVCPFDSESSNPYVSTETIQEIFEYKCRTCRQTNKIFSLRFESTFEASKKDSTTPTVTKFMKITKFGEYPAFGPHAPTKLISMLGRKQDIYLKGRRSESLGLGIGAFTYYRRLVQEQKNEIIELILKAANMYNADKELIEQLKQAKKEDEFAKSMEHLKHEFPDALKIQNENPLSALNTALSAGIHNRSDEECLNLAQDIRTILSSFVERFTELSKNDTAVKKAFKEVRNFKGK